MSLFDNTKIVGWTLFIIGLLMIVNALVSIYDGVANNEGIANIIGYVILGIGSLIAAVMYFLYGNGVRTGKTTGKLNVLGGYVRIVGVTSIIIGLFGAIGAVLSDFDVIPYVVKIILGIVVAFCASKMNDGKNTGFDKILWIVLLVIFVILLVSSLLSIGGGILGIISAICYVIMYLFMLVYMFDKEVKDAML